MGSVRVPDVGAVMLANALADHIIWTPVFGTLIHIFFFPFHASSTGGDKPMPEFIVPVAIKSLWVSAKIESHPMDERKMCSSAGLASHKRPGADITA